MELYELGELHDLFLKSYKNYLFKNAKGRRVVKITKFKALREVEREKR